MNDMCVLWRGHSGMKKSGEVVAIGFPCNRVPSKHTAWLMLEKYLRCAKKRPNSGLEECPHEFNPGWGPLKEDDLETIMDIVWPERIEEEKSDD